MRTKERKSEAARRPSKGRDDRKEKVVHARFSASEFAAIEQAAALAGVSVSGFLRSLSLDGAGVLPFLTDEDRAVLALIHRELRAIGVDLNGLARAANRSAARFNADVSRMASELQPALVSVAAELEFYATRCGHKRSV